MIIQPDKIIRSKRKTVALTVDSSGRLIVRAPLRCSEARILAFIEKKSDWILKHQARKSVPESIFPSEDLNGFVFSLQGKPCEVRHYEGKRTFFEEENSILYLPQGKRDEEIRKCLKRHAKTVFSTIADNRAREMGTSYKALCVSSAKGRWGSCSADNTIRFTFRLLYAPTSVIDYVVVHELAHTFYKNHGKDFWRKVEQYCPDWKIKRKWLKDHGYFMKIF